MMFVAKRQLKNNLFVITNKNKFAAAVWFVVADDPYLNFMFHYCSEVM